MGKKISSGSNNSFPSHPKWQGRHIVAQHSKIFFHGVTFFPTCLLLKFQGSLRKINPKSVEFFSQYPGGVPPTSGAHTFRWNVFCSRYARVRSKDFDHRTSLYSPSKALLGHPLHFNQSNQEANKWWNKRGDAWVPAKRAWLSSNDKSERSKLDFLHIGKQPSCPCPKTTQ